MTFDPATLIELAIDNNIKRLRRLVQENITRKKLHIFFLIGNLLVFILVQIKVPDPYLDEIFHIPQTQRYCEEDFDYWDPAITTPPGLYLLTSIPLATLHIKCHTWLIRMTNLIFSTIMIPFLISCISSSLRVQSTPSALSDQPEPRSSKSITSTRPRKLILDHLLKPSMESIVISSFPLISFFGNLYYTDVGSLAGVLACWTLALRGRHYSSAIVGAWSVTVRQTNIIWLGFILATTLLNRIQNEKIGKQTNHKAIQRLNEWTTHEISQSLEVGISILPNLIKICIPYIPVFIGFLVFLIRNEGIVLGHKENHQPVFHGAQLFYFIAFNSILMFPVLSSRGITTIIKDLWKFNTKSIIFVILPLSAFTYIVKNQTVIHPFLLADNRHYTFYIFRWFILKHWWFRYALIPFYLGAWQVWTWKIRQHTSSLWFLGYLICYTVTLVPTPLVEPRYFLIPSIILRIQLTTSSLSSPKTILSVKDEKETQEKVKRKLNKIPDPQKSATRPQYNKDVKMDEDQDEYEDEGRDGLLALIVEYGWYTLINIFTIGLFLWKEFEWDGWEGKMRFMW